MALAHGLADRTAERLVDKSMPPQENSAADERWSRGQKSFARFARICRKIRLRGRLRCRRIVEQATSSTLIRLWTIPKRGIEILSATRRLQDNKAAAGTRRRVAIWDQERSWRSRTRCWWERTGCALTTAKTSQWWAVVASCWHWSWP